MRSSGFIWLALFGMLCSYGFSQRLQQNADRLAMQYFDEKEYDKANVYFAELYDKYPDEWYGKYYESLLGAKDLSKAEKITRRQLKNNRNNVYLYVYLGKIFSIEHDDKKAKDAYERALKELNPVAPHLQNLAAAFSEEHLYDYAIAVYDKGRKASPDYPFFYEKAEIYKEKGDLAAMINKYLDALDFRESELQTVQGNLQNSLGYDDDAGGIRNPLLKQELQKRIQKNPDKIIFTEFLIFIQKQQHDFEGAFVQSRALDKRLKEDGQRIHELAQICVSNQQWETAKKCYEYLKEKGPGSPYYVSAVLDGLNVSFLALTQNPQPDENALLQLEGQLAEGNEQYKKSVYRSQLIRNLATLKAFYLNKPQEAVSLLEDFIAQGGVDAAIRADFKLLLGDIYLVKGEIWEASLLYSQVEKDFKYEAIGQEAKFRNAKLSFYAGDFAWAKTQADVLKGATSKLISNDALDLSLIITDAIGVDTNDLPLKLFASAELMVLQHRYQEAMQRMDSVNLLFSNNTLGDDIYFKKAAIYTLLRKYPEAEAMYKNIIEYYPSGLYGDDAQFKLASLYEKTGQREKAQQAYQDVLTNYPGSTYTVEARKRYRELRGDALNN